jgi:hypothetical protein
MATTDTQQAVSTILGTTFQYSPIDYTTLERGLVRKADREAAKTKDLTDIISLRAQNLPAQLQGDLNKGVDEFLEKVKSGELKVGDVEYIKEKYALGAKSQTYINGWKQIKEVTAIDPTTGRRKQIISYDENGNPVDNAPLLDQGMLALNNYDPNLNSQELIAKTVDLASKATMPKPLSADDILATADTFFKSNADTRALNQSLGTGKDRETLISSLTPQEREGLIQELKTAKRDSLESDFARDKLSGNIPAEMSFIEYSDKRIRPLVSQSQSKQSITSTQYTPFQTAYQSTLGAAMGAGQTQQKSEFEVVASKIEPVQVTPTKGGGASVDKKNFTNQLANNGVNVSQETAAETYKQVAAGTGTKKDDKGNTYLDATLTTAAIAPKPGVAPKEIKVTSTKGDAISLTPSALIYDEKGKGVLIGTSKSTAKAETGTVKGKTVVDTEVLSESVVRLTPALIKRLQVEYGVEIPIAQPAQPAAQATKTSPELPPSSGVADALSNPIKK